MSADLLKQFPLPVAFPRLSGEHRLLVWWTYNEKHHITVAKSDEGVMAVFRAMLADERPYRHQDAKPVSYHRVQIVAPPEELALKHALVEQAQEKGCFRVWVGDALDDLVESGQPLPAGARRCTDYRNKYEDTEVDDFEIERHWNCVNCLHGWVMGTHTLDSYYDLKVKDYRNSSRGDYITIKHPSYADPYDPSRQLYAVVDDHGPHREGSVLMPIDPATHTGFFGRDVKFFCHAEPLPIPEEALRLRKELDDRWKAEREAEKERQRAANTVEAQKRVQKLKGFFES